MKQPLMECNFPQETWPKDDYHMQIKMQGHVFIFFTTI